MPSSHKDVVIMTAWCWNARMRCLIKSIESTTYRITTYYFYILIILTFYTVSQKVPTFKLSVALSNLNRFSNFLHCWKAHEIVYKTVSYYLPHLRHIATLPREIKNSNFLQM